MVDRTPGGGHNGESRLLLFDTGRVTTQEVGVGVGLGAVVGIRAEGREGVASK